MKIVIYLQKNGVFEDLSVSFIDLIIHVSLHCDVKSQINCPVCDQKKFGYIASVDAIEIGEKSRVFKSNDEEENILTRIKIRIEQILRNLPSCVTKNDPDEEHKGYLRKLFSFHSNYELKNYYFE